MWRGVAYGLDWTGLDWIGLDRHNEEQETHDYDDLVGISPHGGLSGGIRDWEREVI